MVKAATHAFISSAREWQDESRGSLRIAITILPACDQAAKNQRRPKREMESPGSFAGLSYACLSAGARGDGGAASRVELHRG